MNRSTAAAVAVAAVLGVTGGTWVGATVGTEDGDRDPTQADSPTTTRTGKKPPPTTSQPPLTPAQLLYMDATTIHDGYTHVTVEGFDLAAVEGLVRIRGGWLVLEGSDEAEDTYRAFLVGVTGERKELGEFTGAWDINEVGDRFVAQRGRDYTVFDLITGDQVDLDVEGPDQTEPAADATFSGTAILTGWVAADGTRSTLRTELASGRSRLVETGTLASWTASPRGLLITGQVSNGAITCLRGGAVANAKSWWTACNWALDESRPKYSPNGEQLLAVPLDPDGGPPATYAVLGSGSGNLVDTIKAPPLALDAEWGDNNEVFVLARKSARSQAGVLYRCVVGGECSLERSGTTTLVLGAGV